MRAAEVYQELLDSAKREPGRAYRAFYGPAGLSIRAFIDGASRLPGLSLKTVRSEVPAAMQLPRFRGATVQVLHGTIGGQNSEVIYEIAASEQVFTDVFIELASNLIEEAADATSTKHALAGVTKRLAKWARFFDMRGSDGLSRPGQLGLLGELMCLNSVADRLGVSAAVDAWRGPTGAQHDFQLASVAIEVKLTTSAAPERFAITSERQLDDGAVPLLLLFAIVAQDVGAGGTGLVDTVDRTRERIARDAPAVATQFEERLLEAGYSDADRARYTVHISIREAQYLRVHAEFPRIVPSDLRVNVFAVSYEIPWAGIAQYRLSNADLATIFKFPHD